MKLDIKSFVIGLVVASVTCTTVSAFLPPVGLACGMKTADGCVIWFDRDKVERFKQGQAGQGRYGNLVTGQAAQ